MAYGLGGLGEMSILSTCRASCSRLALQNSRGESPGTLRPPAGTAVRQVVSQTMAEKYFILITSRSRL